jgi:hypothetical protein
MDKIKLYILFLFFWPWIATVLWSVYKFKTSGLSVLEKRERKNKIGPKKISQRFGVIRYQ